MKRKIILMMILVSSLLAPLAAKNFLPPGKDVSAANLPLAERSAKGEVIITPEVYSYHAFGITEKKIDTDSNTINMRGDIILSPVSGKPKKYKSEPDTVYFSYNIKGIGEYKITLTAADLKLKSDANKPCFETNVTGKYPEGYTGGNQSSEKQKNGTYSQMVLRNGADQALGKYGSIELTITATFKGKGQNVPLAEGYSGVFTLVLEPLERQ